MSTGAARKRVRLSPRQTIGFNARHFAIIYKAMEETPLSKRALARIKAVKLEAGGGRLRGPAAFWRGIGMSSKPLREDDPAELSLSSGVCGEALR
jgi:hypothetical protein